ncbi:hypothetical protein LEA_11750, partial [human gut metagenome]
QTYQEIAQRYNISVRKVTREIQQCLKLLREDLGDYLPLAIILFPHFLDNKKGTAECDYDLATNLS